VFPFQIGVGCMGKHCPDLAVSSVLTEACNVQLSTGTESSNEASKKPLCKRAREGAALHEDRQVKVARLGAISKEVHSLLTTMKYLDGLLNS